MVRGKKAPHNEAESDHAQHHAKHQAPDADISETPMVTEGDRTAWAVPYTDLTMLLLVFFVIMVMQADPQKHGEKAAQELNEMWPMSSPQFDIRENRPNAASASKQDISTAAAVWQQRLDGLARDVTDYIATRGLAQQVQVVRQGDAVHLQLSDRVLFPSGSADVRQPGRDLLDRLIPLLRDVKGTIEVTGHTDNRPIRTARFPSNWELSAARAIAVVRHLRGRGVAESRMKAVGHGANRPIASNATAEGRARNRRVTIAITPPLPG